MRHNASGIATVSCLLLVLSSAPAQDEARAYENTEYGFSLSTDPGWAPLEVPAASNKAEFAVQFSPPSRRKAVEVLVRVRRASAGTDAKTIRDLTLKSVAGKQDYSKPLLEERTLAAQSAFGFRIDMRHSGAIYRVRQVILVANGLHYTVQVRAPQAEFTTLEPVFERALASFQLRAPAGDSRSALLALAGRCGSELDWASSWEAAAARAKAERKLVLVTVRLLGGFDIADTLRTSLLMDPDVSTLVQRRFVPLAFKSGMSAPFVAQQSSYGMSGSAFGTSVLLVTPEGEVVGDTAVIEATAFDAFLRRELELHPAFDGAAEPGERAGLELAQWHLERGELAAALALCGENPTLRGRRLEAAVLRRQRKGEAAVEALSAAYVAKGDTVERGHVLADSAWVYARLGGFEKAESLLVAFLASRKGHPRVPEAKWLLGVCRLRTTLEAEQAGAVWRELVEAHPENRWAWRAAANLTSTAFELGFDGRFLWPSEEALEAAGRSETAPVALEAEEAEAKAIAYLLQVQREDGSWVSPSEAASAPVARPSPFTVAKTAICAQALLPARERPEVRAAIDRALGWLRATREAWKQAQPKAYYMDYRSWSLTFELWFYADALRAEVGDPHELRLAASERVASLAALQKPSGGWSYFLTKNLGQGDDAGSKQSISFVTAAVGCALVEAKQAGVMVPDEILQRAGDCLEAMRGPKHTFAYFSWGEGKPAGDTPAPGAAGRGPACALALLGAERAQPADLTRVLDLFLEWRHTYAKEQGKTLMHCGADGQGSHYLLFDYAFAARAVAKLPRAQRARYEQPLRALVLSGRAEDGSFVDNPINGSHYGTAMALIALQQLRAGR